MTEVKLSFHQKITSAFAAGALLISIIAFASNSTDSKDKKIADDSEQKTSIEIKLQQLELNQNSMIQDLQSTKSDVQEMKGMLKQMQIDKKSN